MRMLDGWDIETIKMLHSCDAGDKSVITVYPEPFINADPKNGYSEVTISPGTLLMRWY